MKGGIAAEWAAQDGQVVKVLHVIGDLAPESGGPAKACFEMARAVARRGHEVAIYTTDFGQSAGGLPGAGGALLRDGVQLRFFPLQRPRLWLASWPMAAALRRDLGRFDILHLHSLHLFHDWVAGDLARRYGLPYLVRPHGSLDPYIWRRRRLKKAVFDRLFQDRVLRNAAAIHFTAEEEMRLAAPFIHGAPGVVIPNGLDLEDYASLPPPGTFRRRHPEIGSRRIVLFLGRLNFKKGLDLLVEAFARLAPRRADLHLVLAGPDGGFLAETTALVKAQGIAARTTFTGMLTGADKLAAFADAAVFVLPSYSENFGIAVIEAMACGLPVLISDRVNIWREVVEAGAGRAAPCEAEALSLTLESMLAGDESLRRMGEAGRDAVGRRFACPRLAARLESVYADLIAGRPIGPAEGGTFS
jgi:glycosyltransferase involved in cell wall biosynthesis